MLGSVSSGACTQLTDPVAAMATRDNGQVGGRGLTVRDSPRGQLSGYCRRAQMDFCSALMERGRVTNADQMEQYLAKGANLKSPTTLGVFKNCYPLHFAAFFGHQPDQPVVAAMLAKQSDDIDINAQSASGFTALDMACGAELSEARRAKQVDKSMEPDKDSRHNTVLALLDAKAESGNDKRTPLHYVAENGFYSLIGPLVASGFSVNNNDNEKKESPLHAAAARSQFLCTVKLVQHGATIDSKNHIDQTPLHNVCLSGRDNNYSFSTAVFLMQRGADYTLCDKKTRRKPAATPLEHAARSGKCSLIHRLVSMANPLLSESEKDRLCSLVESNTGNQYKRQISEAKAAEVLSVLKSLSFRNKGVANLEQISMEVLCQWVLGIPDLSIIPQLVNQMSLPGKMKNQVKENVLPSES